MVPAMLVLSTLTAVLIGVRPKWAPLAWAGVAFSGVVGLLAETLQLPPWTRGISPFSHVPAIPAESFDILPILLLITVATGLTAVGLSGMERRDIARSWPPIDSASVTRPPMPSPDYQPTRPSTSSRIRSA
jgi:ABC-2 type transport system permease protein